MKSRIDEARIAIKSTAIFTHLALISLMMLPMVSQKVTVWWLDNLINLQLQWSVLAAFLILLSLKPLRYFVVPLAILYSALTFNNFAPFYKTEGKILDNQKVLNIAQINIRYGNPSIENLIFEIGQSEYDVIVFQEVGKNEREKIRKLTEYFPYSVGASHSENFPSGMALFSRWPIVNGIKHDLGYIEGNIIEAIIQPPESTTPIQVFALHPSAPRNKKLWELRNSTLAYVGDQVLASRLSYKIVIGDINLSPWSPIFKYLVKTSALKNSANGYGYIPSWAQSTINKFTRWISSAYIDHCLVSDNFNVIKKKYIQIPGSDHVLISTSLGFE